MNQAIRRLRRYGVAERALSVVVTRPALALQRERLVRQRARKRLHLPRLPLVIRERYEGTMLRDSGRVLALAALPVRGKEEASAGQPQNGRPLIAGERRKGRPRDLPRLAGIV